MPVTDEIQVHVQAAEQNFRNKKYDEAFAADELAVAAAKDAGATKEDFPLELLTRLVKITRDLGEWSDDGQQLIDARAILDKALQWYRDDVRLLSEQGWLHFYNGYHDEALAAFEKALSKVSEATSNDDRVYALEGAGASLRERDQFTAVEAKFAEAIRAGGKATPGILIERGWLRLYQRKYDLSFADFESALSCGASGNDKEEAMSGQIAACHGAEAQMLGPIKTSARELVQGWVDKNEITDDEAQKFIKTSVSIHSYINNYKAALLGCNLLLERDSENIEFYELKISALKWLRRFDEAEKVFNAARKISGESTGPWKEIAHSYFQQKRLEEAYGIYSGQDLNEPDPG